MPLTTNKGQKIDGLMSDIILVFICFYVYNDNKGTFYPLSFIAMRKEGFYMNKVNMGDKYTHRITLRLNDEQYSFILQVSELLGVSPSDYLRMSVNTGMIATKNSLDSLSSGNALNTKGMVGMNENVETDKHDIV